MDEVVLSKPLSTLFTTSTMFSFNSWQPHLQFYSASYPAPRPIAHKVWILDCAKCGKFLTNRGMKAVLLLRPNVALYSSDALPVNCSVYSSNPHAIRPATACPSSCDCLTQTMSCHGCGQKIGYYIVHPCTRCTSSISTTNRATNGHRFVFHSSEIKGTERLYITDEPGVIQAEPPPPAPILPVYSASALHNGLHHRLDSPPVFYSHHHSTLAVAARPEYLPTPPLDTEDVSPNSSNPPSPTAPSFPFPQDSSHLMMDSPLPMHSDHFHPRYPHLPLNRTHTSNPYHNRATSAASSQSSDSSPPPLIHSGHSFGLPADHFEAPLFPPLQAGDVLYWHHLSRHGEIPGVMEDARARRPSLAISVGKSGLFDR
ncbi:FAM72 protein-domain-containing protein [Mycena vitilis]|nr:FAM72 protein-domain-containing protein [Mycena vitilis]